MQVFHPFKLFAVGFNNQLFFNCFNRLETVQYGRQTLYFIAAIFLAWSLTASGCKIDPARFPPNNIIGISFIQTSSYPSFCLEIHENQERAIDLRVESTQLDADGNMSGTPFSETFMISNTSFDMLGNTYEIDVPSEGTFAVQVFLDGRLSCYACCDQLPTFDGSGNPTGLACLPNERGLPYWYGSIGMVNKDPGIPAYVSIDPDARSCSRCGC